MPFITTPMGIRETPQTVFSTDPTGGVISPIAQFNMNKTPK